MFELRDPTNTEPSDEFRKFSVTAIDSSIRQAINMCWHALPTDKRNADEVEKEIRRLVDRAIRNLREDVAALDLPKS